MPKYKVKQPDGKWSIFSTIVHNFTDENLNEKDVEDIENEMDFWGNRIRFSTVDHQSARCRR